jgi:hypothetical protein
VKRRLAVAGFLICAAAVVWLWRGRSRALSLPPQPRTVADVLAAIGSPVDKRLRPVFAKAGVAYPPPRLALLAFKREKRLELHAADVSGRFQFVRAYPILAASGEAGPKNREGDHQVPEGFYRIELLNPNSRYHLSLRVNYPNDEDRARAAAEDRDPAGLGGDIMIHGGAASAGCLAMGDPAAEDLFVLAARTGLDHIELLIFPRDFRREPLGPEETTSLSQRLFDAAGMFLPGGEN